MGSPGGRGARGGSTRAPWGGGCRLRPFSLPTRLLSDGPPGRPFPLPHLGAVCIPATVPDAPTARRSVNVIALRTTGPPHLPKFSVSQGRTRRKPCHSYKGGTPPDTSRHSQHSRHQPSWAWLSARQASWRLWLALCDHGLLTARRAGVCRSLCLCLLNVLSQQSDPGFAGSDLRGGRGPPSFHSHTDASLSSLDPTKLFAAPGAWPLFRPPECSDPKSPRGWFLLATQASGQNLHLLKECFLDQSSSPNPKSII